MTSINNQILDYDIDNIKLDIAEYEREIIEGIKSKKLFEENIKDYLKENTEQSLIFAESERQGIITLKECIEGLKELIYQKRLRIKKLEELKDNLPDYIIELDNLLDEENWKDKEDNEEENNVKIDEYLFSKN